MPPRPRKRPDACDHPLPPGRSSAQHPSQPPRDVSPRRRRGDRRAAHPRARRRLPAQPLHPFAGPRPGGDLRRLALPDHRRSSGALLQRSHLRVEGRLGDPRQRVGGGHLRAAQRGLPPPAGALDPLPDADPAHSGWPGPSLPVHRRRAERAGPHQSAAGPPGQRTRLVSVLHRVVPAAGSAGSLGVRAARAAGRGAAPAAVLVWRGKLPRQDAGARGEPSLARLSALPASTRPLAGPPAVPGGVPGAPARAGPQRGRGLGLPGLCAALGVCLRAAPAPHHGRLHPSPARGQHPRVGVGIPQSALRPERRAWLRLGQSPGAPLGRCPEWLG